MKEIRIYVHGKGGAAEEAGHYKTLFPNCEVIGFDYRARTPWEAREEFPAFFARQRQRCDRLTLIANSIGAFFAMSALDETLVDRACLISPVVNMENPTCILYGERDKLTSMEIVSAFAERRHAKLTVMPDGEHWFHTAEQMRFLDDWLKKEDGAARKAPL